MKSFRLLSLLCFLAIILLLTSCGGSSGSSAQTVSGVAAAGAPLNGTVYLKDSSSSPQEISIPVASDGSFSLKVNGLTAPFLLKAIGTVGGNNYTLYSFAAGSGVANVNPLSNLAVVEANGGDLTSLYATPDPAKLLTIKNALATNIAQIQTALQPTLSRFGATSVNFISDPYVANHNGLDLFMDLVSISVSNGMVTIVDKTSNNTITSSLSNFITDTINVAASVNGSVCILPSAPVVNTNGTVDFTAIVVGTVNQQVTWSIVDTNGGTITSNGVYTAPTNAGTYHVIATSTADTTKSSKVTVTVTSSSPPASTTPLYVYVTNFGDNTISQYTSSANGSLTAMTPATVATGNRPYSISIAPSGKSAYVTNWADNTVSQYMISANGSLTALTPATVATGNGSYSVTVDPSSKYVYVANSGDSTVSQYTIGSDGSLAAMSTQTVATGITPYFVTVDPSGKYAYVANVGGSSVSQYMIGSSGGLTAMTPATVPAGAQPFSVTVDPSGKYAYVANAASNNVSQYTIGSNGGLTAMTPTTVAAGSTPISLTVDPSGKYVYVANEFSGAVSQYVIGANGGLTAMTPANVATGSAFSVTVDSSGKYAYVADFGSNVWQYTIGSNGGLSSMSPATVAAGKEPTSVTTFGY